MDLRQVSDDFFTIGNIAVLQRKTGNEVYDFDFRNHFECKSVITEIKDPILLHIGAVEDYAGVEDMLEQMGMKLLVHEAEHLRCSTIEGWYPALKEKTPFTKIYDELPPVEEILKDFSFPIFIKGNRQTNRHKKSQCIIEDKAAYESLRTEWSSDSILSWQKVAVREYVPLKTIDSTSYPDMVPISYEFRFFYFEGKCMAYGPYWYMGNQYTLDERELAEVLKLTDWAADKLAVTFPSIDVAKTASGEWIIIEVNDAQESGFVGVNPITLWNNTIEAAQNRTWISVDDLFEDGTVIMGGDPAPNITIEEMRVLAEQASTEREIAKAFSAASNKAWWVEDNEYDYEEGTEEHRQACRITDEWFEVSDILKEKIFDILRGEGVSIPDKGQIAVLSPFMERNGYRDGRGWWVKRKTAYIMMGIQGSGKSTFCSEFLPKVERINLDTLHTRNKEALKIAECHDKGCDYVVDNTNPTREDRARYIPAAREAGYYVVGYFMQSRLQECIKRNDKREGKEKIPAKAIAMTSNKLEMPSLEEGFDELYFVGNDGETMSISEWGDDR